MSWRDGADVVRWGSHKMAMGSDRDGADGPSLAKLKLAVTRACAERYDTAQIPTRLPHTLAPLPDSSLPLSLRLDNCLTHIEHLHKPKTLQTRKVCTRRWVTSLANVATTSLAAGLFAATRHAAITLPP